MRTYKTDLDGLGYACVSPGAWKFVDLLTEACIGDKYPTKDELLKNTVAGSKLILSRRLMSDGSRVNAALTELRKSKTHIMEAKRLLSMISGDSDVRAGDLLRSINALESELEKHDRT